MSDDEIVVQHQQELIKDREVIMHLKEKAFKREIARVSHTRLSNLHGLCSSKLVELQYRMK
jgi:hypothetical protein